MAKKRKKAKKRSKKRKVKRVKTKVKAMKKTGILTSKKQAAYTLSLTGGIIIFVAGILALLFSNILPTTIIGSYVDRVVSVSCGALILLMTAVIRRNAKTAGIIILLLSVIALIFKPYGFIMGPVLSLIGSALLLIRK